MGKKKSSTEKLQVENLELLAKIYNLYLKGLAKQLESSENAELLMADPKVLKEIRELLKDSRIQVDSDALSENSPYRSLLNNLAGKDKDSDVDEGIEDNYIM